MDMTVVLVEIENPGNLGAVARTMANFNLKKLVLVNPKCSPGDIDALVRSKHASQILKNAKIAKSLGEVDADYLVATTALLGTDYNIPRSPLTPEQLAKKAKQSSAKYAVVFGREGDGLTNSEILKCDFSVTIPCSAKYPTLNISHAASIIFYELFKHSREKKHGSHIAYASKKEKDVLLGVVYGVVDKLQFKTAGKKKTQVIVWKRMIGKANLTKREVFALIGFFKKL
jgi:TrmH family RNA methyltransferase